VLLAARFRGMSVDASIGLESWATFRSYSGHAEFFWRLTSPDITCIPWFVRHCGDCIHYLMAILYCLFLYGLWAMSVRYALTLLMSRFIFGLQAFLIDKHPQKANISTSSYQTRQLSRFFYVGSYFMLKQQKKT